MGTPSEAAHDMTGISLHRGKRCINGGAAHRVINDVETFASGVKSDILLR